MTGRRSHGRLSALNGVVHQGTSPATTASRSESHRQGGLDTVRQWAWEGPWAAVLVRLDVRSLQP